MQILPALEGGGVEMVTLEVNRALVARGHRSLVLSAGGQLVEQLEGDGGQHITLDLGKKRMATLLKIGKLRRLLVKHRVDVVNVRSRLPAWITIGAWKTLAQSARPRLVTTVHGLNSISWYSHVMTYGERVIAVSDCCRDYVLEHYPQTNAEKITVIPGGVDSADFPYDFQPSDTWLDHWKAEFPQLANRFVVLIAGRITRLKGHEGFLQVIDLLKSQGLPVHGLIVGGEDPRRLQYAQSLREKIERLDLEKDVTFTGHRSDIREIMSASNAVVSMNIQRPESFGRTVLEAVKLGRPTIGYAHGGVEEVLSQVYPAGCVPLQDLAGMAEKLTQVYSGKLLPPEPTDKYELSRMLDKEIALYESLAN